MRSRADPHLFTGSFVLMPPPGASEQADGNNKDDYLRERFSRSKNQEQQHYPNQDRSSSRKVVFANVVKEIFDPIHKSTECFDEGATGDVQILRRLLRWLHARELHGVAGIVITDVLYHRAEHAIIVWDLAVFDVA